MDERETPGGYQAFNDGDAGFNASLPIVAADCGCRPHNCWTIPEILIHRYLVLGDDLAIASIAGAIEHALKVQAQR